ncbi:MAG: YlmC/YmxH family sporulation protein [Clostridia bacterium]
MFLLYHKKIQISREMFVLVTRIDDLKHKEVISISEGSRVGFVGDVEFDCGTAKLTSIIVFGRQKFFGFLGREDDYVIPWSKISVIGEDTVLVNFEVPQRRHSKQNILSSFFEIK